MHIFSLSRVQSNPWQIIHFLKVKAQLKEHLWPKWRTLEGLLMSWIRRINKLKTSGIKIFAYQSNVPWVFSEFWVAYESTCFKRVDRLRKCLAPKQRQGIQQAGPQSSVQWTCPSACVQMHHHVQQPHGSHALQEPKSRHIKYDLDLPECDAGDTGRYRWRNQHQLLRSRF